MSDLQFDCPSCEAKTYKLFAMNSSDKKLRCPNCSTPKSAEHNVNLGQTVKSYVMKDGTKGKLTVGKAWEIENRKTTPEGVTINRITGREAQY